jgi:hypothetical protein
MLQPPVTLASDEHQAFAGTQSAPTPLVHP